ncbi:type II toxin-antitoxin system death-on-curing family toxin [uncultured Veillonella sp.]|uniref:type II toxin-antitoxin system death-on-curing family toxin n=1 Tax=uncultured Veillonella sp. TaxID=159268 RepID=UPI0034298819
MTYIIEIKVKIYHHTQLENAFVLSPGVRDENLLASAVNTPFQTFMENDLYPSIYDKAAQLCYGIANNHPFTDGNKRTALHSIYVYLIINGFDITATQQDVENMIIDVASGNGTYIGSHKLVHTCSIPNQTHI